MSRKNINVSDRVENQLPAFIRQEDRKLVEFLFQYYKSQEKTGRPYDILNNLLNYLDLDSYDPKELSGSTQLLQNIGLYDKEIQIESIDGFQESNGSIMVDNEVIYYENVRRGPDAIVTPGVSASQFDKKKQQLENPFTLFDGTRQVFPLSFLGTPVAPPSAEHLIVITYNNMLIPGTDYSIEGSNIRFTEAPRARTGSDDSTFTQITYLVGYADQEIVTTDSIPYQEWEGTKNYPMRVATQPYEPTSEIGLIIKKNNRLQQPYTDYTVFQDQIVFKNPIGAADNIHVRSVEYIAPEYGSGASAVVQVDTDGEISKIIPKQGGSGYRLNFNPKVEIFSTETGKGATARTLVGGIKDIQLIGGGQGYTSTNPPIPIVASPSNVNGTPAELELEVDDETGTVSSISIKNSGSGYDFIPAISFKNPGGAKISGATIDGEGRLNLGSIQVDAMGSGYSNPPLVYIDPAPADGINAQALARINQDGQVYEILVTNRGRGYTTTPRVAIIDPIGAQVLDVTIASGAVTDIELLTGGKGYTDAPSVYIVDDRKDAFGNPVGGTGAEAVATIFNGEITDINIINFGEGYSADAPPKIFIAEPSSAKASVSVGFGEVTGYDIYERGSGYQPSVFLGCSRGVSGPVAYDSLHNEIYAGEASLRQSTHPQGAVVTSLDSLFIKEVFDKFRRQYLPTIDIDYTRVNPIQVIKNIKDFYVSKGTEQATQYLFKILFGEDVSVSYPRDEIISPSAATWVVDTILRVDLIEGDPRNLIDSQVQQFTDPVDQNIKAASALIENVITIIEGTDTIYELAISEETLTGEFKIPYKTKLVEPLTTDGQIITVDSTIGWPERNGSIRLNDEEVVQYKEKSLNQFIECTRSKNGVVEDWDPGTIVQSEIYVYVNRGTAQECKMRILGIAEAGTTVLNDTGSYYLKGDKLKVANLGSTAVEEKLSSWLYNVKKLIQVTTITPGGVNNQTATVVCENPHGLLVSDQVTVYGANPVVYNGTFTVTSRIDDFTFSYQINVPTDIIPQGNILLSVDLNRGKSDVASINKVVSEFTTNIQNSFFNDDYVYTAASGLPNYKVGPFIGSALIPGNQRKLLRFPRVVQTVSERKDVAANSPIGAWVNGVSIWTYKSFEFVRFGPLTNIAVDNPGIDYDAGNKPKLEITGGGGSGATAEVEVDGSLVSFDVTNGGSGYTEAPLVSIVGGGGSGATAQAVITGGRVSRILVEQKGSGYTSQPSVDITGGGGSGATASASVRGPVSKVNVTSFGSGYTELPSIKLNSGEGALAQPIVINGRIVSIAIINSGSGYTTAPTVIINGDGFGAIAKAIIGTVGEDKGRVLSVQITNRGVGYTQGNTTVRLEAVGQLATFTPEVFKWNKNYEYDLVSKYDGARGYVFTGYNNQFGGEYAHLSDPKELRYVVGDNVFLDPVTQEFKELSSNFKHSPILGWAFDGNPIYGPYGYIDPTDQNSGIRRLRTSYALKENVVYDEDTNPNPSREDGPSLTTYPAGTFIADYKYNFQSGDLDQYNGRFCKTPEYPDGVYAYFITIDASEAGLPQFPYIVGPQFNSLPDNWNFNQDATQENIPSGVVRYRDPYVNVDIDVDRQPNQEADVLTTEIEGYPIIFEIQDSNNDGLIDVNEQTEILEMSEEATLQIYDYFPQVSAESRVDIEVETTTQFENAQIDGFVIENPGVSYQVDDTVFFDDEGTGGFGASALIESVKGQKITAYTKEMINDRPYGVITTEVEHELRQQDEIIVNSRPVTDNTNKTYKVKVVSGVESISVNQSGVGYNEDIPPTFELITSQGQDAALRLNLLNTGQINTIDIINSGNGYDTENPPQIRVSHPQQYKKTRYWMTEYLEAAGIVELLDIKVTAQRYVYICGTIREVDGDRSGIIAKFDDLGQLIWERNLLPQNAGLKRLEFVRLYINDVPENDAIYIAGQSYNPDNEVYNPDIFLARYDSGFNNANEPDGILAWQKSIAGISGSTRRDYLTTITLDQEQRIYLGGYTDSNSPDPDDMWVIQCDLEGNLVEKRKLASEDGSERLHQLEMIADDRFFFTGVNDENDDCIFGVMFFDGANLEFDWIRQIPTVGGYVRNPRFVIDAYDDVLLMWDVFNNASSKFDKIQINKFALATANTQWEWSKTLTLSSSFISMNHAGVTVDEFDNYTIAIDVVASENSRYSIISYLKYDGSVITESKAEDSDSIGWKVVNHDVDNSGDCILALNRQQSDQIGVYRFDTDANLFADDTKQNVPTINYFDQANTSRDTAIYKFGSGALKLAAHAPVSLSDYGYTDPEWSVRSWVSIASAAYLNNHKPVVFEVNDANATNSIQMILDGDATSADFGKVIINVNGTQAASSDADTYWTGFNSSAWNYILFQKREESLGLYRYECFIGGNLAVAWQSTTDIGLDAMVIGGPASSPTATNSVVGWFDDIVIDDAAPYSATFSVPTAAVPVTSADSDAAILKFDRLHTKRDSYALTGLTNYGNIAFTDVESETVWTSINTSAFSAWEIGPGGLQILDFSQTTSNYNPTTYNFTATKSEYGSKTSTIPSPLGKRLEITANVVKKFYFRDALYQKIDNVLEFTFNQDVKLTKGSILQQFNSAGVTTAFGTITDVPDGTLLNPGFGNKYKVGKIFGTFNNDDRFRTDIADVNQIEGTYFDTEEPESPWQAQTAYNTGDRVYQGKRIYEAQGAGTSGTIAPVHTAGVVSDGVINWSFIDDAGKFDINLLEHPYPRPQYLQLDMPEWDAHKLYAVGQRVWHKLNVYEVATGGGGVSGTTPPTHTTGDASDGGVTWSFVSTSDPISDFARLMAYDNGNNYSVEILEIQPGSTFIPGDVVSLNSNNIELAEDEKSVRIVGFASVKKIRVTARLEKDILRTATARTDHVYCTANSKHYFNVGDILFVEGFQGTQFNGSFFIDQIIGSREFTFAIRDTATEDPTFNANAINNVNIYAKHPTLLFTRGHQYVFDVSDVSNFGYYLSFSQDNQFKLEYSFNNIVREGTPGIAAAGSSAPFVKFSVLGDVTNISYYFDPSRIGEDSPVGSNSFIDVITTPYDGRFTVSQIVTDFQFKFPLEKEPEKSSAEVGTDEFDNPYSFYSTTSKRAVGPINSIKLISPGGFYQKLPIISDIASFRQIEKLVIVDGGTEYAPGVYYDVPILGDGEGAKAIITVENDDEVGSGTITNAQVSDPGKGYTTASIDIDSIPGILGSTLAGSGGSVSVIIPSEGSGASVFLTGKNIGKIKRLKNNEFGFGYSHDYTLRPEITFPVNLQLFNTSILSEIQITDPGSGYTSTPAVVVEGGGGEGATAEAVIKNNRLSEIIIKNPGAGYSSEPTVTLKSEFNYVVNLDLNYLQFNFPHGITQGAEITLRADNVGSTTGVLPKPSSAGLTTLVEGQVYYAIAGDANSLESDQLRFALTPAAAAAGDYITFLTQGEGRQTLLTEVFGGKAKAVVETSRFLEGEEVFQGPNIEQATATGVVSTNTGWQIGPKILKIVDYNGDWEEGEKVTGVISKASGVIDNFSIARGVLNIGSLTKTPGRFIDDVGKPSEIVQKIQDSFFYQNFSYVIKSETPINKWKSQLLINNHPAGFNMFGQLQISGGKDISGRRIGTEFTKQVNINNYSNVNEITSFAAAQPVYTDYNNTEILFRKRRLTSSEEILTSIVKKIDDISGQFDGIRKSFPILVEGEQVIVSNDQLMITINGIIQAPVDSYNIVGGSLVFNEAPKPPSKIVYRFADVTPIEIYRINLFSGQAGIPNYGIFPTLGQQVQGANSDAVATVIDSGTNHIDVINITGGPFELNEEITRGTLFSALVLSVDLLNSNTIFEFGESITNLNGDTAIIEETNIDDQGVISDRIVLSKTSGTAKYETGVFNLRLNDFIYSAKSKIAGQVTNIGPYADPVTGDAVDTLIINQGSTFQGLIFERLVSLTNPNIILDDISKSSITPVEIYNSEERINADFLDFEEIRTTEVKYENLTGGTLSAGDTISNKRVNYGNPVSTYHGIAGNRFYDAAVSIRENKQQLIDWGDAEIGVEHPDFYYPGDIQTNQWSRYTDAHRFIQKNRQYIAARAYDDMITQYPTFIDPNPAKCKRDMEIFMESLGADIYRGGNVYTRKFTQQYFDANGALVYVDGETAETRYAYTKVKDYALLAITNGLSGSYTQLNGPDSGTSYDAYQDLTITADPSPNDDYGTTGSNTDNTDPDNCSDVQAAITTLWEIVDTALTNENLTELPDESLGTYSPGQVKCRRDAGLFIDALANDVQQGGNFNIVEFTKSYFDNAGAPLTNGLVGETAESITVFNKIRDLAYRAINNLLFNKNTGAGAVNLNDPTTYGGTAPAYTYDPNYANGNNQDINNCANVKSYIATLTDIATVAIAAGNLTNVNSLSSITDGTFVSGETVRTIKVGYKDKSTGLFFTGNQIRGVTSGAVFSAIGSNSGLRYIYAGPITGTLQYGEYITNSTLTNQLCTQSVVVKKKQLTGSKSIRIPSGGYLSGADSFDFNFGTGDFTLEGWIYPEAITGTQHLFDFRRNSAAQGFRVVMDAQQLKTYNGTTLLTSSGNVFPYTNTWYHVAVVRVGGITRTYVNGTQAGSDVADTNNYLYAPCYVGTSFQQTSGFTGYVDNVCVRKGFADYTSSFQAPISIDFTREGVVLGLDGEAPFILSTTETYATYTGQNTSSTTIEVVDYENTSFVIEDIDLGNADAREAAGIISLNAEWIANEAVGRMKAKFPDFTMPGDVVATGSYAGTAYCLRDTKDYILGAIVKDLQEGGNYHTLYTARTYLSVTGRLQHVENEIIQTVYTWDELGDLIEYVLTTSDRDLTGTHSNILRIPNNFANPGSFSPATLAQVRTLIADLLEVIAPKPNRYRDSGVLMWKNRDYIAEETVGYLQDKYQKTIQGTDYDYLEIPGGDAKCERDIKDFILPAIINDIAIGGTYHVEDAISRYLDDQGNISHVENELNPMLDAFEYAKMLAMKAVNNLLISPGETAAALGAPAWAQDDYYQPQFTTRSAYRDSTIIIDDEAYPQSSRSANDRFIDASNAIRTNKNIIAKEAVAWMNDMSKYATLQIPGGPVNCEDDIKDILDALIHDLLYDCNEKTYDAASLYIETENNSLKHIEDDYEASVTTFKLVRDMVTLTMRNAFGRDYIEGNSSTLVPVQTYEQNPKDILFRDCADAIDANIRYIAEQAVALGRQQYPSLSINGGIEGGDIFQVTAATYDPATGVSELTIGSHSLVATNRVTIQPEAITFTCTQDNNATEHSYPRKSDPAYNQSVEITAVTATTITVNVGASPANANYPHTFVSAKQDAVVSNGWIDCVHDVTDILRSLVFNLKFGGNNMLQYSTEFYVNASNNLQHITSQATETNWILNKARDLAVRAMRDQLITNTAAHTEDQRFYNAAATPTTRLRNSDTLNGIDLSGDYNNNVTRSFNPFTVSISNNSASGLTGNEDAVFKFTAGLPTTPVDEVLLAGGGQTDYGFFVGFRDSGAYLRIRAGNSTTNVSGGATHSDTGLALLDVPVADLSSYLDGNSHEIVVEIRVGGNVSTGAGRVKLFIDGDIIGQAETPGGSPTGLGGGAGEWLGTTSTAFGGGFSATQVPVGEPNATWTAALGTLSYYRSRLVDYDYTGTETDGVAAEITTLMSFVTDGISNPGNVNGRSYTLPIVWPIKYTPEIVVRDTTVTYDFSNGGQDDSGIWNNTCPEVASAIDTLMDILINTITEAAENQVNYLTQSVTKTTKATGNTAYQEGTCYNVITNIESLFDLFSHTLGAGTNNEKMIANMLLFNQQAIAPRAFQDTQNLYPTTNLTQEFADGVLKALRYDLITGGNAGSFRFLSNWFDGEGNFIAYTDVTRSHLLYCLTRVREYVKSVLYQIDEDPGWDPYPTYRQQNRFEYFQEAGEFIIDSSLNPIEYALERSEFPTEARVTFIANTDVSNLETLYEMGVDYNTDPALVQLTPVVDVGYDRAEYRIRINRTNNFRRGDILSYTPQGASIAAFTTQSVFYCINATADWFEIGVHTIHDSRFRKFKAETDNGASQVFSVLRRSGITRNSYVFPGDPSDTPIQGGFQSGDVIYGSTSNANGEVGLVTTNSGKIIELYDYYPLSGVATDIAVTQFENGEEAAVQGATTNKGLIYQTRDADGNDNTFVKLINVAGTISEADVLEGLTSGAVGTVGVSDKRFLVNLESGSFADGDIFFNNENSAEAEIATYVNKSGSLTDNTGGKVTMDVETIDGAWDAGDIVYGSATDYILEIKGIAGTQIQLNQYIHGRNVYQLELGVAITESGVADTFRVGDQVSLLQGTIEKNPGFRATVTKYVNDPDAGIHRLWIAGLTDVGTGADISEVLTSTNNIGKIDIGSNFPTIYAGVQSYTDTEYSSYGKVIAIEQSGITATIWVEDAVGEFVDNMAVYSDGDWVGAVSSARKLIGRADRYFRGFDGEQTTFKLTIENGQAYFPDPAGHLLAFVNGVLQPPGATASYVAFSDSIQFNEAPDIGSEFIGYYVGKLRQLDDISFEFDSLRSSFNLKRQGLFYSLTLTEGVSSNTILPENNIIISLNGIIQKPGVAYELVGSRVIFAEVPRAGSTFVGFSYIGSDADVIAATVVPPIETGDRLRIDGEEFEREVALIESSNSLITFEYTGSVKGRNAAAISEIISGKLSEAILTSPGDGYTSRPNVDVISSSGFDAQVKALNGVARIDVKTSGAGYTSPVVLIDNEVPDDFVNPSGTPINGGFDIFAGEGPEGGGGTTITPGTIAIQIDPANVTVNQGQTAAFTVVATVSNDQTLNYQWQKKEYGTQTWTNIIGANQSSFTTISTTQADDGDEYRVAITAAGATPVYSLSAILTVQTGATVIANFSPVQIFDDN